MDTTKHRCSICNLSFLKYKAFNYHINRYHSMSSNKTTSSTKSTPLKRSYTHEVENLLDRGAEAISSGSDRKRVITRWKSKTDANFAAAELLEATVKKENQWKKEYIEARKNLDAKLRLFTTNEKNTEYMNFIGNFQTTDDGYDLDMNNELKFLDYMRDLIEFGE